MLHLVAGLVFFLLSPGVLLTIPAGSRGLFASGQTSLLAAAVHAVVFVAAIYALHTFLNVEGFGFWTSVKKTIYKVTDAAVTIGTANQTKGMSVVGRM